MTEPFRHTTLRIVGVTKAFGASNALTDVSFDVARGEVHALVGENGAGKSTLVKIVTGILEPDAGEILLGGLPVRFATPIEARRAGLAAVYQDPKLFPHLDVAENISMGPRRSRPSARSTARQLPRAPAGRSPGLGSTSIQTR